MFKDNYNTVKTYFKLKANNKKLLFHLFFSSFLRSISFLAIPFVSSRIINYISNKDYKLTFIFIGVFLITSLVYVLCHHYNYKAYANNSIYVHNKLQELMLDKVTSYDENFTKDISVSYIINTGFNDFGNVMQIPDALFDAITKLLSMIISLIILTTVNIYIGIFAILINIISIYTLQHNIKKRDYHLFRQRKYQDNISELMGEVVEGNKEINSFDMKDDLNKYLDNYKKLWTKEYLKKRKYTNLVAVIVPSILGFGKILIYLITIYLILNGKYEIATLILVIGYYEQMENTFSEFYTRISDISSNANRVKRVYKILNYKTKNMLEFGNLNKDDIKGQVEFNKVSFTYEKQEILKDVSFVIEPKKFVAIVGKSGSGKSTIFRLLLRLYKTTKGHILLDDTNIYEYNQEVYTSNVSIVTQKPFIFDMSIRENLSLVESNFKKQVKACKKVGIHDYITKLEKGYNTKLVSDAENISTGQKQLLALARTLLSKSEVLLFDEVTSALDIKTSKEVINIFKVLKKEHTILMITHKPSLMKLADEIIVVDNGKIVGRGTHKELMKDNIYYQNLQK